MRRSVAKLAAALCRSDIPISPASVAKRLKRLGFRLRVNCKSLACADHPDRDRQFRRIAALRRLCAMRDLPLVSIDTKKKELVGRFKNPGAVLDRAPRAVHDHDFRSLADGLAVPYGI